LLFWYLVILCGFLSWFFIRFVCIIVISACEKTKQSTRFLFWFFFDLLLGFWFRFVRFFFSLCLFYFLGFGFWL
jgi:hypothetical protein